MTTFPRGCPSSRYRMASGTSASGYVLSMTGASLPVSMSCLRNCRSSLFGFTVKLTIFWLTNGDNTSALTMRSTGPIQRPFDSPLLSTSVPLGVSAPLHSHGGTGPRQLEDEIVLPPALGEVLLGVVDDVVCAERSD